MKSWLFVALLGGLPAARAETASVPVAVEYEAIEGCPPEADFWAALSSRSSRVQRSEVSGATATLRVSVILTPQGVLGRLQIVRRDRTTEPRFVEAANCEEVVEALALTAALSVEGDVAGTPEPPPPPPAPPPPPEPEPAPGDSPYTDRRLPIDYIEAPRVTGPEEWKAGLHAYAIGAFVVDERASLGLGAMIVIARRRDTTMTQLLGLGVAASSTASTGGNDSARYNLTSAELVGCPTTFGEVLLLRPCALFQVGILDAKGQNISNPEHTRDRWWAPGFGLFGEVPASGVVRLQFSLRGLVPLYGYDYQQGMMPTDVAKTMDVSPWLTIGAAMVP